MLLGAKSPVGVVTLNKGEEMCLKLFEPAVFQECVFLPPLVSRFLLLN